MEALIAEADASGAVPGLLLHSCCGPCSTYCIKCLADHFAVTVFYYNPNIFPPEEYHLRAEEQKRFVGEFPTRYPLAFAEGAYDPARFYEMARGLETVPEGGERCFRCYEMRLREAAEYAKRGKYDFFTTTLSISPLKNAEKLNEIGRRLEEECGVRYLYSDFKKKDGYRQSAEIARAYGMYRQYYCGCEYSKRDRDAEIQRKAEENKEE